MPENSVKSQKVEKFFLKSFLNKEWEIETDREIETDWENETYKDIEADWENETDRETETDRMIYSRL